MSLSRAINLTVATRVSYSEFQRYFNISRYTHKLPLHERCWGNYRGNMENSYILIYWLSIF